MHQSFPSRFIVHVILSNLDFYYSILGNTLWKRFWTVVENHCGKHLSSLFSGFCFAGHEATIYANEGSGHGKSHIWYCWWGQMMTNLLRVSHFVVAHEVKPCYLFFFFFGGRKLASISVWWSFALTSFAIWFVSIVILLE